MKKLYIETYGCQMNVADSEVVASVMQMAGYEHTENLDEADAVFLNTCSIRDNAEQKIYHRLDALDAIKRKRPLIIGVIGCMAERVKDDLIENHHCDLVAGPDAYLTLPDLIAQAENGHKAINIELSRHRATTTAWRTYRRICQHHERMQQLLPLLHRALYTRTRTVTRRGKHTPRSERPARQRLQRGDSAGTKRQ